MARMDSGDEGANKRASKQTARGHDSTSVNLGGHTKKDFVDRARFRDACKDICSQLHDNNARTEQLNSNAVADLKGVMNDQDGQFNGMGANGKEMAADGEVIKQMAKLFNTRLNTIREQRCDKTLTAKEYADKLTDYMEKGEARAQRADRDPPPGANPLLVDEEERDEREAYEAEGSVKMGSLTASQWAWLGRRFVNVLGVAPRFHYVRPLIAQSDPEPTAVKVKRERAKKDADAKKTCVVLKHSDHKDDDDEQSVSKELDIVHRSFKRELKRQGTETIDYYLFVIDPRSFSKTIENMYYITFLIKDGHVRLHLDDECLPQLSRVSATERDNLGVTDRSNAATNQGVVGYTMCIWRGMIDALGIETAAIHD